MNKPNTRKKQMHQCQRLNEVHRNQSEEAAGQLFLFTDIQLPSTTKHSVDLEGIRSYICPDLDPRFQESAWMLENTLEGTYSYA